MFLIKKRLVFYFLIFSPFLMLVAQENFVQIENIPVDHKKLVVEGEIICLPIYPKKNSSYLPEEDILQENLEAYTTKWDNQQFNPYWNEDLTFPFQLAFQDEDFSPPVDRKMVVTSRYGWRRGRPHQGIDIDLQVGDSVKSILDGKIRYVGYHGGHGNTVVVRHHNGLETVYAHLSKSLIKENEEVKKGQTIGTGGVTGNARGSHLHLEVRYHGKSINPEYLFEFASDTKIRSDTLFVTKKWMTPRYHRSTRMSKIVIHKTMEDIARIKEEQKKIYTVRKGDTLHRIANKHGLAVSEICKTNSLKYNSVLKIGQQIIIN
ncbi:M23 family metallopeptidase [Aquimarina macrocephali]|uniref:M23 family metallopeptidase n=1 Tax=Aquimarina macrocephali TaxID=666563 RepID=UPI000A00D478|nr:M23 family metallopeptidase [Aquimarina macrocephali]